MMAAPALPVVGVRRILCSCEAQQPIIAIWDLFQFPIDFGCQKLAVKAAQWITGPKLGNFKLSGLWLGSFGSSTPHILKLT